MYSLGRSAFTSQDAFRNALSRMSIERRREGIAHMNFQPRGMSEQGLQRPASYQSEIEAAEGLLRTKETWNGITAEAVARMRLQNRFKTGLDIARYTAALMRADMAAYDGDPTKYTQSLGCWHGFIAQQK